MKAELAKYDEDILKKLDGIKREKLNWTNDADDVGINIDEELDEEEIGQRFTKLRPEGGRQSRFGGDDRDNRGRRGRSQGPRQQQPRRDEENQNRTEVKQPKVKKEKYNGANAEDFPAL